MRRVLTFVAVYVLLSLAVGVMALVSNLPHLPKTGMQWIAWFALALPAALLSEWVGEVIQRNPVARAVERRTHGRAISSLRMGYLLGLSLLISVVIIGVVWLKHGW